MSQADPAKSFDLGGGPPTKHARKAPPPSDHEVVARRMIIQAISDHPTPWRVEGDWSQEVIDRERRKVCSCTSQTEAELVVKAAEDMARYFQECEAADARLELDFGFVIPPGNDI